MDGLGRFPGAAWLLAAVALAGCTGSGATDPTLEAPGRAESSRTNVLEMGATAMQRDAPTDALDIYLSGFHPMKASPEHQFEAHHFCQQMNEDFAQCALYDGNTAEANLNGIEYIISEQLFESLPNEERQYWHPHNGEILSGQLVGPGLPEIADKELMRSKMNSYGKTWHTWNTGHLNQGGDTLPLGEPALAWSFNRFGEAAPGLVESRDERMGIDTEERRRQRQDLIELAHPQEGVDALKDAFERPTEPIPGVVDKNAAASEAATGALSR
jgi:hypothetical protein